jgi:hypothetical protein
MYPMLLEECRGIRPNAPHLLNRQLGEVAVQLPAGDRGQA